MFWRGDEETWSVRHDGSSLANLLSGEVPLIPGMGLNWQPVRP